MIMWLFVCFLGNMSSAKLDGFENFIVLVSLMY